MACNTLKFFVTFISDFGRYKPVFIHLCTLQPVTRRYLSYNSRITNSNAHTFWDIIFKTDEYFTLFEYEY
jgi:hypothetical protein